MSTYYRCGAPTVRRADARASRSGFASPSRTSHRAVASPKRRDSPAEAGRCGGVISTQCSGELLGNNCSVARQVRGLA